MSDLLIWLDLETTGLNFEKDYILEVALMATNMDLMRLSGGSSVPERRLCVPPREALASLDPVVEKMHRESGLLADLEFRMYSPNGYQEESFAPLEDEAWVYDHLVRIRDAYVVNGQAPNLILAGNSIHFDRGFIRRFWPRVDQILHYRMVDVSSIKVLVQNWYDSKYHTKGVNKHRAADDVEESLMLLRKYRDLFFHDPKTMETDKTKENLLRAINSALENAGGTCYEHAGKNAESFARAYEILHRLV